MTPTEISDRVSREADARFGETIEHLLRILDCQQRYIQYIEYLTIYQDTLRSKCKCEEFQTSSLCDYCRNL